MVTLAPEIYRYTLLYVISIFVLCCGRTPHLHTHTHCHHTHTHTSGLFLLFFYKTIVICSLRRKAILYSGISDRILEDFSTQKLVDVSTGKCTHLFKRNHTRGVRVKIRFVPKSRKRWVLILNFYESSACSIIFYNVFLDISMFLFFS